MSLSGRNALITGSTSGIGWAIANQLATRGVNIMLNGLEGDERIETVKQEIRDHGVQAGFHGADLSKPDQVADLIRATHDQFGQIDILVNNAGIQHTDPIEDFPIEKWDAIIAINLSAAYHTIRHTLPIMRQDPDQPKRIINIASVHGLVASIHKAGYIAAKHGINGLSKVVALETAKENITCNTICPGWVLTPLVEKQVRDIADKDNISYEAAKTKLLAEKQPSEEFVTPEDIGQLAVFLCGDGSDQITGSQYVIDGGWTTR
jgi:3-hydroxybutyrate dehydrogenase